MNRINRRLRFSICLLIVVLILFSGCVSAGKMLEKGEQAWVQGQYTEAINEALKSYEKAVDKNKSQTDIDAAEDFLFEKFPIFNERLSKRAEDQLNGTDADRENAWKTYQDLVDMNARVSNSVASSFLEVEDFSKELQRAKDIAAQIKYVKSLELIGQDDRSAYIEAAGLLLEINTLVPGYRDIGTLLKTCYEEGTITVAFSYGNILFKYDLEGSNSSEDITDDMIDIITDYIKEHDYPDFLNFMTISSVKSAEESGAVLFIDLQGDVRIESDVKDSYQNQASITWERSYKGTPTMHVTRIGDTRSEVSTAEFDLSQSIAVEFYPVKYDTESLTADMYNNQYNNTSWMADQLYKAERIMGQPEGSADMVIWARMEYGGVVDFLTSALVSGSEGDQELSIEAEVYEGTKKFIEKTLPDFLDFGDMDVEEILLEQMFDDFLSKSGVRELLTDLEG